MSMINALIDSHCHLNQIKLEDFNNSMDDVLNQARASGVSQFLCVCITREDVLPLRALAEKYPEIYTSVGIHPNEVLDEEISSDELIDLAQHSSCIAIGETGLDYYRITEFKALQNQRERFKAHIQAAKIVKKPLIIHTREAAEDTLQILQEENASEVGGVLHCFSESLEIAQKALELNFYISFSGIITFKNAIALQEVVQKIPLDRILLETDSPYLAPVPHRGKQNHPALVRFVAEKVAQLKNVSLETVAKVTTENFKRCFL